MNKTLCENRYNRAVKRSRLPAELSDHAEIMARIESFGWQEKVETCKNRLMHKSAKARPQRRKLKKTVRFNGDTT